MWRIVMNGVYVRPSNGTPYEYADRATAERMMGLCCNGPIAMYDIRVEKV